MSFVERIVDNLQQRGEQPALYETRQGTLVPCTGTTLLAKLATAQRYLQLQGVAPGDRVALLASNSAEWVVLDLAIVRHGAICVPLYARQDPRELAVMLDDCQPSLLIAADAALRDGLTACWQPTGKLALIEQVLTSDAGADAAPLPAASPRDAADLATLIYTSGTSGEPKGVMISHGNVGFMLQQTRERLEQLLGDRGREDRVLHYLPFCFAGSRIMLWTQLLRGNALRISTDLNQLVEEMKLADPHYYLNVPAVLERIRAGVTQKLKERGGLAQALFDAGLTADRRMREGSGGWLDRLRLAVARRLVFPRIRETIGASLEFLICGSALLGEETQRFFQLIGIPVYQVYGLTETTAIVSIDRPEAVRPGWVGHPLDGCEVQISAEGELLCRGPNIFGGYWNKPEATAAVLRDGWFHTGDQVERDETGNLRIIGRLKDLLVPESGHNVAPAKLEQKLMDACPAIAQAVVVGHGRPFLAAIVTGDVSEDALDRALAQVNESLPHYMRVRKVHCASEPFSVENGLLTANQKLRRAVIETHYQDAIEGMYA